jgi:nicotinate-nucleotide adenylyltransferase
MADIIIARRHHSGKLDISYPHVQIDNDIINISSACVREKIAAGEAWHYLVPADARVIIEDRKLYGFSGQAADGTGNSPAKSLIVRVEEAVRESLSLERFLHSRNTALLSRDMCARLKPAYSALYGKEAASPLNPESGYLAGIGHDLAKELDGGEMLRLAEKDGKKITRLEKEKPTLLHGRASAVLLKERFGVNDEAVLEAVALHTGGGENMGPLAKVVYTADKMEVSRENLDPSVRNPVYFDNNLDRIFFAALTRNISSDKEKKQELSEETIRLLQKMQKIPGILPEGGAG